MGNTESFQEVFYLVLLYHLDRNHSLNEGKTINLRNIHEVVTDNDCSPFAQFFKDGVSLFGLGMIDNRCPTIPLLSTGDATTSFINVDDFHRIKSPVDDRLIEITFELVRRLYFPQYPSRFQSLFTVKSIEEFNKWPELFSNGLQKPSLCNYHVYEINVSDNTPSFDSKWLNSGISAGIDKNRRFYYRVGISFLYDFAYHYWSRDLTDNPRLEYLVKLPVKIGRKVNL